MTGVGRRRTWCGSWRMGRLSASTADRSAFSASTPLVGRQEEHPACKNWVKRCWCGYLSPSRCKLFAYGPADANASQNPIISCLVQIQTGFTFLAPAYPGCSEKEVVEWGVIRRTEAPADRRHRLRRRAQHRCCFCCFCCRWRCHVRVHDRPVHLRLTRGTHMWLLPRTPRITTIANICPRYRIRIRVSRVTVRVRLCG